MLAVLATAFVVLMCAPAAAQFPPAQSSGPLPAPALPGGPPAMAQRQLVVDVVVNGNQATKDYEVQKHIQTRKDREFDAETLQGDVRRLITSGLFREVKPEAKQVPGGVLVTFNVVERPRIGKIKYLGNRGISDKKLGKEIGVKEGEPLNSYSAEESRRKIEELYHREGYPKATVTLMEGDKPGDKDLVFLINEGQLERIEWVTFEGNTIATDTRLKTQIQSKPGFFWYFFRGKVDREKIDQDVEKLTAYYRALGFFRARISRELEFDESGKWLTLKFIIDEGPRYTIRNVSVEGNKKFAAGPLLEFLELKSGEYFNQAEMNRDLNTLTDVYGSQGHVFADVQADPRFLEEPGQLDLVYRIKEGDVFRVGEVNVHIAGEFPHTKQTVVLNRLSLHPGDIIDSRKLRDSERRLKLSQLFEVNPAEGDPPKIVVRPPDLTKIGTLSAAPPPAATVRGQEPEQTGRYYSPFVIPAEPRAPPPVPHFHP
jgi:outer membrane protein insertion porin family